MAQLSRAQLYQYGRQAGFTGSALDEVVAIAFAESGGNTAATHVNGTSPGVPAGTIDRGVLQINNWWNPGVSDAQAFDPTFSFNWAYKVTGGRQPTAGSDPFRAYWVTVQNGAYRKYLTPGGGGGASGGPGGAPGPPGPPVKTGSSNGFPLGQCTWWADERYHQLTGIYIPWIGNAYQWYGGAQSSGWNVSGTPPNGIPSIIVMQPNVQGAGGLGHVGVVEKVNSNGTVTVSNMNWASGPVLQTVQGYPIRQTTINVGAGIGFAWTGNSTIPSSSNNALFSFVANTAKTFSLAPNASVTEFLVAMDSNLTIINPFDVQNVQQDSILGMVDPISWLSNFGTNIVNDTGALIIRIMCILLSLFLLYRVVNNFVDFKSVGGDASKMAQKLGPLLAAA